MKEKNNSYKIIDLEIVNDELVILMQDLETGEYFEITEDSIKNKESKTDLIIHEIVINYLIDKLFEDVKIKKYIKNVTK